MMHPGIVFETSVRNDPFGFGTHIYIARTISCMKRTERMNSIQFESQCNVMQINTKSELELDEQGWSFQGQGHPHRRNTIGNIQNFFS